MYLCSTVYNIFWGDFEIRLQASSFSNGICGWVLQALAFDTLSSMHSALHAGWSSCAARLSAGARLSHEDAALEAT